MRIVRLLPVTLLLFPAVAAAQSMNAELFYKRSSRLMAKGPTALFSMGEVKTLMGEVERAGKTARERRLADVAANKPPRYCPPAKSSMGSGEFMTRLGAIPAAERARIDMSEVMARILVGKYPCPR